MDVWLGGHVMNFYPHHIGDFDKATRHLTRVERSIYRDLLDLYYDTEAPLPLDCGWICRKIIARSNEESTAVEQTLNEFFTETPTGWYHARCEDEISKYHANNSQKSQAGKASAAKRATKKQQAINGNSTGVERALNGTPTNQEPITINQEPIEDKKTRAEALECPSDVVEQVWNDFLKIRKAKKSPLTNTALAGIQREADNAGVTLETALKTCCERGWVGFKAEWLADKSASTETVYQKSMRLRVAEIAPALARSAPGTQNITDYFRTIEATNVKTLEISQ